ncbi:hypothetical protein [Phosphitispora fastidiosa]|uniref:hypothetical protein n=1 Tax=Phosphitispora fastidiosa TaxID=2837202 RepID=UPI001E2FFD68|nr:hypothetical protein [Phosphitispora fastidiosa]MBU7008529.1 uncharacterized Zn finger protein (UPF0148 family) [Phosphitispora fastidiosa]
MLKKVCPYCGSASFSSTTLGDPWLCPRCQKDISHVPVENPNPGPMADLSPKPEKSWMTTIKGFFKS